MHNGKKTVRFGPLEYEPDVYGLGAAIFGMKGSAKTCLSKRMMNDAMAMGDPVIAIDTGDFLYDHCRHFAPKGTKVRRYNVTKATGLGVDVAAMCGTESQTLHFVAKVVPEVKGDHSPYFREKTRDVVLSSVRCLCVFARQARRRWNAGDLIWLATRQDLLSAVCKATAGIVDDPYAQIAKSRHSSSGDVGGTVESIVRTLLVYSALADHAALENPIEALDGGVTIFEWSDRLAPALEKLLAVVMEVAADEALSRVGGKRLWLFLDEIRSLQPLEALGAIARRGRRSSVCPVLTVHEISGMYDRYSRDRAEELMSLMGLKAVLRVGGRQTARWCSDLFGSTEMVESVWQPGDLKTDGRWSVGVKNVPNVTCEDLMQLPYPDVKNDKIVGYLSTPDRRSKFSCKFLADSPRLNAPQPPEVPREWETPRKRTHKDLAALGIPFTKEIMDLFPEVFGP